MKTISIIIGSITYALKIKRNLRQKGVYANIIKIVDKDDGCQYCLLIREKDLYETVAMLRENNIQYKIKTN